MQLRELIVRQRTGIHFLANITSEPRPGPRQTIAPRIRNHELLDTHQKMVRHQSSPADVLMTFALRDETQLQNRTTRGGYLESAPIGFNAFSRTYLNRPLLFFARSCNYQVAWHDLRRLTLRSVMNRLTVRYSPCQRQLVDGGPKLIG